MRRFGFTGTQDGMVDSQYQAFATWACAYHGELHHGDCVGADRQAHKIAHMHEWRIVIHPGPNKALRAYCSGYDVLCPVRPNLVRNADIVSETDELVATPKGPEELRSGTWSTIRYARKLKRPITIFWPDGSVTRENHA